MPIKVHMTSCWKQSFVFALLSLALMPAHAQAPALLTAAIDPSLLVKANGGDIGAEVAIGDAYAAGNGAAREPRQRVADYLQAAQWYGKAAAQGDAGAQGTLGLLYSVGMGVDRDDVEAYYWLCLASAVKGPNQARYLTNRQSVGEHITTDQQAAVQDRIASWQAAHPHPLQ